MAIKASTLLAAAVLSAAPVLPSFFQASAAEPLMPTGVGGGQPDSGVQPFDPTPSVSGSITRQVLTYGFDSDGNAVPKKTLRITNNAAVTMYPIMRSPNTGLTSALPKVAVYNPYDPPNKEYRGYIGYMENGKYYFGLKPGQSILISIPLVFWNGARIGVGTDNIYLTPAAGLPNPLQYDPNARRSITVAEAGRDTISNGVIMWYRAETSRGPADDAEDQLAEWTIRDHAYLSNPQITAKTHGEIPDNQLLNLINYDVSNVDSLYLPLALAANDVWLLPQGTDPKTASDPTRPNLTGGWSAGSNPAVFGWTGATDTIEFLQTKIRNFTAENNTLLGSYFGGRGWPFYNFPNVITDPSVPIKIPSGANIFPQSPMKGLGDRSSYDNEKYLLSSGGTGKIAETIASSGDQSGLANNQIRLSPIPPQSAIDFVRVGLVATPNPPGAIPGGTSVTAVDPETRVVTLSQPLATSIVGSSVSFTRPQRDYASEAMIRLWHSWAQYYLAHWRDRTPGAPTVATPIKASNDPISARLTFQVAHPELVKGMAVTGPGLDDAQTEVGVHQGDAVILEIASDFKSVVLSQVMIPGSTNQTFTFSPPKALLWTPTAATDPGYPLIGDQFKFSDEPAWNDPFEFSQQVYLIMASMNQISRENNSDVFKFMQDIVGANMGYIFNQQAKESDDGKMVTSMIRDAIKSVLRGVSDFTKYPDLIDDQGNHTVWYPDPAKPRGGQSFNVFNLDPFVWFVHVQLGFSGYGFSVDDDTADVGAGGATELQLSITGTAGLKNSNPWTIQAPYGPVKNISLLYSGPASATNGDTLYNAISGVSNTTPIRITTPQPHQLSNEAIVVIDQVALPAGTNANGRFKIGNVTRDTFDLFDEATGTIPIASSGAATSGRWSYPLHPYIDSGADLTKVFYRVTGDDALGTFQGTFVSVNGVDRDKTSGVKFRIWQLGRQDVGRLLLDADLTDANGAPLPAGTYSFTFFGIGDIGIGAGDAVASSQFPVPLAPLVQPHGEVLERLEERLTEARKIDDPEKRSRALERVRTLQQIANRGVDPDSQKGRLLVQLLNSRAIQDPVRRRKVIERIRTRLEQLEQGEPGETSVSR